MARFLTDDDKLHIYNVYKRVGTYAGTARETGFSASTVRKYVQEFQTLEATPVADQSNWKRVYLSNLDLNSKSLPIIYNIGKSCELTEEEKEGIRELWNELSL